jgi:hypothetical protein
MTEIHPFRDAIESLIGVLPLMTGRDNFPIAENLENILYSKDSDDETLSRLCDYCNLHPKPAWATGESIIDAADLIVERAFENTNLKVREAGGKRIIVFNPECIC